MRSFKIKYLTMNAGISYILINYMLTKGIERSMMSKSLFESIAATPRIVKVTHCFVKTESLLGQKNENPNPTNQRTCSVA